MSAQLRSSSPVCLLEDSPRNSGLEFTQFYRRHFSFVIANIRRLGVRAYDAEDATQIVFLTAYRKRNSCNRYSSARAWLYGITRKVASTHRRSHRRRTHKHLALSKQPQSIVSKDLERQFESCELVEHLLSQIDEKKREVFILAELYEMSGVEISQALGIKPSTVASRMRHARQHFTKIIQEVNAAEAKQFDSRLFQKIRGKEREYDRYKGKCLTSFVPVLLLPSESGTSLISEFFRQGKSQIASNINLLSKAAFVAAVGATLFVVEPSMSFESFLLTHTDLSTPRVHQPDESSKGKNAPLNRSRSVDQAILGVIDSFIKSSAPREAPEVDITTLRPFPDTSLNSNFEEIDEGTTRDDQGLTTSSLHPNPTINDEDEKDEARCQDLCKKLDSIRPPFGNCIDRCQRRYNQIRSDQDCKNHFIEKNKCLLQHDDEDVLTYLRNEPGHPCRNQEATVNDCLQSNRFIADAAQH